MSYVALATNRFEEMVRFYGEGLGFPTVRSWDRPGARGRVFDLLGLRLEILDSTREKAPMAPGSPGDRVHLVVEVPDIDVTRQGLTIVAPEPVTTSWGTRVFQVRDPEGVGVTFLQWQAGPDRRPT